MTSQQLLTNIVKRTENVVPDLNGQQVNLESALGLIVNVAEVLDQVKRVAFYRTNFNKDKLDVVSQYLLNLEPFDFTHHEMESKVAPVEAEFDNTRVVHAIVGICTEAAELANALLESKDNPLDVVNITEEVGDVMYYIGLLCDAMGFTVDQSIAAIEQKLRKRYPEGFSTENAVNRDLEVERATLERVLVKEV